MKKRLTKSSLKNLVTLSEIGNKLIPAISTVKISEIYGKQHKNVLAKMEDYIQRGKISELNFKPAEYQDEQGKLRKMYIMDERAFHFVVTGFTGEKAEDHRMEIIDQFLTLRKYQDKASRIVRTRFDDPAELNKALNDVLVHVRASMGKETKPHHFIALAENVNEFTFNDRGRGKQLRQNMNLPEYQRLNRNLSGTVKGILKGAIHKNELKDHLESLGLITCQDHHPQKLST